MTRALVALLVIASVARADTPRSDSRLRVEEFRLANGLRVMLAPDPSATAITVHLRYLRGSKDDEHGESGFTYLLEQLLGTGSVHVRDFQEQIDALGGWTTARTDNGHLGTTTYAPARALERVLWLEAERMAGLAEGITDASLARGRDAVRAAWRSTQTNTPYTRVERELTAALWSGDAEAYGTPVFGDGRTVARAQLVDVRNFARRRLAPNTAILVVAGKLETSTRDVVTRYFGWIPMRDEVASRGAALGGHEPVERIVAGIEPSVVVAYQCWAFDPEMEVMAHLLAGDRESRLHRVLVTSGLATEVRAELLRHAVGELRIYAKPVRGVDSRRIADVIRAEVAKLEPTDDDIARAAAVIETNFYIAIENLPVRAELLAAWRAEGRHRGTILEQWVRLLRALNRGHIERFRRSRLHPPVTVIGREAP